jgi:hypothetical protein
MFGGLLGKKDKEQKQEGEAVKAEPEAQKEESTAAPQLDEGMLIHQVAQHLY